MGTRKKQAIQHFREYVSPGKADFFSRHGMDFVMGRREGPWLFDIDGKKRLYNLHCNGGVFNLGHRSAELIDLLKSEMDTWDIGNHHLMSAPRAELAAELASSMPGDLRYTVFGVGGGEAADLAIKVARGYTKKPRILSFVGGYHGHTGLAVQTGDREYLDPFALDTPGFDRVALGDIDAVEVELRRGDVAAVLLESIPATVGIVLPDPAFVAALRRLTEEHGTLLVLDEIQTGFGRTGRLWGFEYYDVIPDMVLLGKGMSGGLYPISATVLRAPLEEIFRKAPFSHISTFGGAELGAMVARRVLEISREQAFLDRVNHLSAQFADRLETLRHNHESFFVDVRRRGLMMGLVFNSPLAGPVMTKTCYDAGLLAVYANNDTRVLQFLPPLVMPEHDIDEVVIPALESALKAAKRLLPLVKAGRSIKRLFTGGKA